MKALVGCRNRLPLFRGLRRRQKSNLQRKSKEKQTGERQVLSQRQGSALTGEAVEGRKE